MKKVVILGGGFAGIAAAVRLTELGHQVTLIERRQKLGGRAFSFKDPSTGDSVDNGQHLFMKCYEETTKLLKTLDVDHLVRYQDEFHIEFRSPTTGVSHLKFPRQLPPPFHILFGFLRFRPLSLQDVFALRKLKTQLHNPLPPTLSVSNWLSNCNQTPNMQDVFWRPLCLAALNEVPERASAKFLQAVLKEAFFSRSDGALMGYSQVGLSSLIGTPATTYLKEKKQTVLYGQSASELELSQSNSISIRTNTGETISPDILISAVPPHALAALLPNGYTPELTKCLARFQPSPILSVNLWYDRPTLKAPLIGLLNTQMEWAFNKKHIYGDRDQASTGHITLLASAAKDLAKLPHQELTQIAQKEFESIEPSARSANLEQARVVCEHRATQTLPLGLLSPPTKTKHPRFFLAGDWVDTGLPQTIEGAVRSGFNAAELAHQA